MALIFSMPSLSAAVRVHISDGINNDFVKTRMEQSMSAILSEVNAAVIGGRDINLGSMNISPEVKESVSMLWDNTPFVCNEQVIERHCLTMKNGYQVRNIPLTLCPREAELLSDNDKYQEAVFSFDRQGRMESFFLTIKNNLYMNVINSNKSETDLMRRQMILEYVEHFRTSYNQKDIKFLNQVFSDDAIIITGHVIQQRRRDGFKLPDRIEYKSQSKQEYLDKLKHVFAANKSIRVVFDEVEVSRHPVNNNFYGVTLHQGYTSDRYHDEGYVFLLWDFTDENQPQIHVRTWQPDQFNGKKLPKDKVFEINDFDIEK